MSAEDAENLQIYAYKCVCKYKCIYVCAAMNDRHCVCASLGKVLMDWASSRNVEKSTQTNQFTSAATDDTKRKKQ